MGDFPVQRDRFNCAMSAQQNAAAGRLVATPRLHAYVAVFDDIRSTDAVSTATLVQHGQYRRRRHRLTINCYHVTLFKSQGEFLRPVRCRFGADRPAPHVLFWWHPRILEHVSFIRDMQQIGVHRVGGLFLRLGKVHGNIVLLTISHQ